MKIVCSEFWEGEANFLRRIVHLKYLQNYNIFSQILFNDNFLLERFDCNSVLILIINYNVDETSYENFVKVNALILQFFYLNQFFVHTYNNCI